MSMIVTDEMLADQRATIAAQIDELGKGIERLKKESAELRAALVTLVAASDGHAGSVIARRIARSALAKATGE